MGSGMSCRISIARRFRIFAIKAPMALKRQIQQRRGGAFPRSGMGRPSSTCKLVQEVLVLDLFWVAFKEFNLDYQNMDI